MIRWAQGAVVQNAFPLIFTLGAMVSLLWLGLSGTNRVLASRFSPRISLPATRVDAGFAALATGLISARAGFVALHWAYFASKPFETLWFWQGGLSWVCGALGAILGLGLFCALARHPFWPLADMLAMPGMVIALACWLGCLADGCAYGRVLDSPLWASPTPDLYGGRIPRWPTQTVGVFYSLLALVALYWLTGFSLQPGMLACMSFSMIAVGTFALSFTRSDPVLLLFGLRLDTVGSAAILLLALVGLMMRGLHNRSRRDITPKP